MKAFSPATLKLLEAARDDGPPHAARDELWSRVAEASGIPTGTSASHTPPASGTLLRATPTASAPPPAAGGAGLLAIGGAVGAGATALGVVLAVAVGLPTAPSSSSPGADETGRVRSQTTSPVVSRRHVVEHHATALGTVVRTRAEPPKHDEPTLRVTKPAPQAPADPADVLTREARLVTEARTALIRGNPDRALALLGQTHTLSPRALEPEELGLEARAYRALGNAEQAALAELTLRLKYPDHALAR